MQHHAPLQGVGVVNHKGHAAAYVPFWKRTGKQKYGKTGREYSDVFSPLLKGILFVCNCPLTGFSTERLLWTASIGDTALVNCFPAITLF